MGTVEQLIDSASKALLKQNPKKGPADAQKLFAMQATQTTKLLGKIIQSEQLDKKNAPIRILLLNSLPVELVDRGLWYDGLADCCGEAGVVVDALIPEGFQELKSDLANYGRERINLGLVKDAASIRADDYDVIFVSSHHDFRAITSSLEAIGHGENFSNIWFGAHDTPDLARVGALAIVQNSAVRAAVKVQTKGVVHSNYAVQVKPSTATPKDRADAVVVLETLSQMVAEKFSAVQLFDDVTIKFQHESRSFVYIGQEILIEKASSLACKVLEDETGVQVLSLFEIPRSQWQHHSEQLQKTDWSDCVGLVGHEFKRHRAAVAVNFIYRLLTLERCGPSAPLVAAMQTLRELGSVDAQLLESDHLSAAQLESLGDQHKHPEFFLRAGEKAEQETTTSERLLNLYMKGYEQGSVECAYQAATVADQYDSPTTKLELLRICAKHNDPRALRDLGLVAWANDGIDEKVIWLLETAAKYGDRQAMEALPKANQELKAKAVMGVG